MSKTWTLFMVLVLVLVWVWKPYSPLPLVWASIVYLYATLYFYSTSSKTSKHAKVRAFFWPLF